MDLSKFDTSLRKLLQQKQQQQHPTTTTTEAATTATSQENTSCITVVILLLSGSFNPVHWMHVESFNLVRRFLEQRNMTVLAGFIAPSSDNYVYGKLGSFAMSLQHRTNMCQLATADSDWISTCPFGIESSSYCTRQVVECIERHVRLNFPQTKIRVVGCEIFGADHVAKYALWTRTPHSSSMLAVCLPRQPYTLEVQRGLQEMRNKRKISQLLLLEEEPSSSSSSSSPPPPSSEMSSTMIRQHLTKQQSLQELVSKQFLHQRVCDYLQQTNDLYLQFE
jgi:nicotinate (nicotinamide) nucleotide adenylyltransferase